MLVPLKVRGIDESRHKSEEFALIALYILGLDQKNSEVYAYIKCELYLVEGLKANMLIRTISSIPKASQSIAPVPLLIF